MADIPHDTEVEQIVLGIALLHGDEVLVTLSDKLAAEDFYAPEHASIWAGLVDMLQAGKPVTLTSAITDFRRTGLLERIRTGGQSAVDYLAGLADDFGFDVANLDYHVRGLLDYSARRKLIRLAAKLNTDARDTLTEADGIVEAAQTELCDMACHRTRDPMCDAGEAATEAAEHADAVADGKIKPGIHTDFFGIDRATMGFQPGDLWVLGAATSCGKTSLAHSVALNIAERGGAVLVVSAEMDRRAVGNRFMSSLSRVPGMILRGGKLSEEQHREREAARGLLNSWKISIIDRACTAQEIIVRAKMRATRWRTPLSLIVVDYLQLMKPGKGETRAQQVGQIAWELKQGAMDLGCPVLLLSQFNRAGAKPGITTNTPPTMYDLKESGDIENHSNVVLLLHRPMDDSGVWCRVAKARDGMTTPWPDGSNLPGSIVLRFIPELTRFENGATY